jgi:hypothetical protein
MKNSRSLLPSGKKMLKKKSQASYAAIVVTSMAFAGSTLASPSKEFDDAIAKCQTTHTCLDRAQDFAEKSAGDVVKLEVAVQYILQHDEAGAARVFHMILLKEGAKKACIRPHITGATMQGLRSRDEKSAKSAVAIAEACYPQFSADLKKGLSDKYEPYMRNVCPIMRKNKALSGLHLKRCSKFE